MSNSSMRHIGQLNTEFAEAFSRAAQRAALIDQCYMWCLATGNDPIELATDHLSRRVVFRAVVDTGRTFQELNTDQRRIIAGMSKR